MTPPYMLLLYNPKVIIKEICLKNDQNYGWDMGARTTKTSTIEKHKFFGPH